LVLSATANFVPIGRKDNLYENPWNGWFCDYFTFCVGFSEVEVDLLTGEWSILRSDILYDAGESLNSTIDIGQAQGAFVFGIGYFLTEEWLISPKGMINSPDTWEYKPPTVYEIPRQFNVELLKDSKFPKGVLGMKGIGEPPMLLAYNIVSAIKYAIGQSRVERGLPPVFRLDGPVSVDRIQNAVQLKQTDFVLEDGPVQVQAEPKKVEAKVETKVEEPKAEETPADVKAEDKGEDESGKKGKKGQKQERT